MNIRITKGKRPEYSKQLVSDIRALLWCGDRGRTGLWPPTASGRASYRVPALGICHGGTAMDGTAHGVVCAASI